ncbi:MAG: TonB family protein [Sulfurimonas sp.]
MRRYLFAFVAAAILYTSVLASIFYISQKEETPSISKEVVVTNTVAISMIKQECHHAKKRVKPKPKSKPKPKKKVTPKPKPKPKPKPVVKEKSNEVVEEPVKEVVEKVVEKEVVQEVVRHEEPVQKEERQEEEQQLQQQVQEQLLAKRKELEHFTEHLIKMINQNKRYPRSARRRGIEGDVDVKFVVLADGGVSGIEVVEGKSIFHRATRAAIEDSFPIETKSSLLDFPHEFQIKLVYVLK